MDDEVDLQAGHWVHVTDDYGVDGTATVQEEGDQLRATVTICAQPEDADELSDRLMDALLDTPAVQDPDITATLTIGLAQASFLVKDQQGLNDALAVIDAVDQ